MSDIHANWHALEAALADADRVGVDAIWCLGDLVGYGPRPNECCGWAADGTAVCLAGNHDLIAIDRAGVAIEEFNPDAGAAARWTMHALTESSRSYLASLEPKAELDGAQLFHASPRDPVWEYILSVDSAIAAFHDTQAPVVLVGHSHVALHILLDGRLVSGGLAPCGTTADLALGRWLLNPGSVGQPRDGDPRAAWLLLDEDAGRAEFHRVEYAVEKTQAEIRKHRLPAALAERLARGL
jgi:diadenosine tetraphosphatase ApaH/serine/threonine PP2A family protein phosphatase